MKVLLDTNVYSAWKRGVPGVAALIRRSERILVSSVVLGELLYGFRHGTRLARNLSELEAFLEDLAVEVLPVGPVTADRYARVAVALRRAGRPIPTNDLWIAAHALESGAVLATRDAHFEEIAGLAVMRV